MSRAWSRPRRRPTIASHDGVRDGDRARRAVQSPPGGGRLPDAGTRSPARQRAGCRRLPAEPAHQRLRGDRARTGALCGAARPQGPPGGRHESPSPGPEALRALWLDTEPITAGPLRKHLETYKIGHDVELVDATADWTITSLIGPASADVAGVPPLSPEHAQHYAERGGIEILAVATDQGLDLITRPDAVQSLHQQLVEAGAVTVSDEAAEIIRVESGRPRFGLDMGPESMPAEAGIVDRAVDFEKGCYIGQEPVARLHYRGKPNRTLRGLRLERSGRTRRPTVSRGSRGGHDRNVMPLPRARPDRARDRETGGRRRRTGHGRRRRSERRSRRAPLHVLTKCR